LSISTRQFETYLSAALEELRASALTSHEARDFLIALFLLRFLSEAFDRNSEGHKEKGAVEFYVPEDVRWASIEAHPNPNDAIVHALGTVTVGGETLDKPGLFSSLRRINRDPQLFKKLLGIVSGVDFSDATRDDLAALTDVLVKLLATSSGAQGGEFYTYPDIAELLVSLLDPTPGKSIYDPACGTGSLLFSAFNYTQDRNEGSLKTCLSCQEINLRTADLARINGIMHNVTNASFKVGNSLFDTEYSDDGRKFDFVITNPPAGLRFTDDTYHRIRQTRSADFRFGPPTKVADYNFIQHVLSKLNGNGRAAMLVGLRPLFVSGQEGEIRRSLVLSDVIEAVITLAPNLLPHTNAQSAVLILNKAKPTVRRNKIQFILADNEYESIGRSRNTIPDSSRQKILQAYNALQKRSQFSAIIDLDEIIANDFTLLPSKYLGIGKTDVSLGSDVQWICLNELGSVFKGTSLGRHEGERLPVLQGRDLSMSYLNIDQLEKKNVPQDLLKAVYSQPGDVLLQRIGQRPQAFLVENELSGVLISDTVYVIRFKDVNMLQARYLVEFLNSAPGQAQLTSSIAGAVIPTISLTVLRKVRVPIPNQAVVELVNNLHKVEQSLFDRMSKARQLRQKLFTIENPEQFSEQLRNLSIEAEVLGESVIQADDLNFQIRNYYPYLLAYGYRSLDSLQGDTKLYKEQLRLAENLMAFLGSIGLMLTAWIGAFAKDEVNGFSKERILEYWQNGISPGDWVDIAVRAGKLLRNNEQYAAIVSFSDIWFKGRGSKQSHFRNTLKNLVDRKNNFKHDRWPQTEDEYATAVRETHKELEQCLQELAFLVQYPMRLVQDSDVDWKTKQISANTLLYVGDHPSLRKESITLSTPVSRDKLYLELASDTLVALHPLLSVQNCGICKMREVFMIDRFAADRVVLKSFEHGHSHDNDEVAKTVAGDLEHWLQNAF